MLFHFRSAAIATLRLQRRWLSSQLINTGDRRFPIKAHKKDEKVSLYEFPSNPDLLLVEPSRLTFGERLYQRFAVGFPIFAIAAFLSVPIGLVTYFTLLDRKKQVKKGATAVTTFPPNSEQLPPLLSAQTLKKLVYVKKPTLVLYFNKPKDINEKHQLALLTAFMGDISKLRGLKLDVYRVNVDQELPYFNPILKEEIQRSAGTLIHLVIPGTPESYVVPISPPLSVTSFIAQISKLLSGLNIKLKITDTGTNDLEDKLSSLKRCLFELKLEGNPGLLEGSSLRQLDEHCRLLLSTSKKDSNPKT